MAKRFFPENPLGASPAPSANRRTIVAIAAATPLLAAAVSLVTRRPAVAAVLPEIAATGAVTESAGYHETEHIRRYYRSAKYF